MVLSGGLASAQAAGAPVVTILGDSIAAGHGLAGADALPPQLQAALARNGVAATVRGAGLSGDTTAGGLARVDFSVADDTALCVIELGANDFLQAVPPAESERNLDAIIRSLKARHIRVLLLGGHVPPHTAGDFARAFDGMFARLAQVDAVTLDPDFLLGVQGRADLHQSDGMHPNEAGVRVMAAEMAPYVASALRQARP